MVSIATIDIYAVEYEWFRPFTTTFGKLESVHIYAKVVDDRGVTGWGESGHLLPQYSGESWRSTMEQADLLVPTLIGADPREFAKVREHMDRTLLANGGLKCAIDSALYDVVARHYDMPMHVLFGGKRVDSIRAQCDISLGSIDEVIADIDRVGTFGVHAVGVKVGGSRYRGLDHDIAVVQAVREHYGPELEISIDCNAAYNRVEAVAAIRAFEKQGVVYVEQPVAPDDIDGMAYVVDNVSVPIMADESIWSERDALAISTKGAADILHCKLPKIGGFTGALRLATFCDIVGVPLSMGCLAAGDYGQAALLHFVAANPIANLYKSKLRGGGLFFPSDIVVNRLECVNGVFEVPTGPGTGLEIDEDALRERTLESRSYTEGGRR